MALDQYQTFQHAVRLYESGDLPQAESICQQILKRNKRDVDALQLRGSIAMKRRDYKPALQDFKKCLSIRPREAQFHVLAGKSEALQGGFAQGIARFERALKLAPGHEAASEWKATVLEWAGDYEQARAVLAPFVTAGNENANMAEVQAKLEIHAGRPREAAEIAARHLARADLAPGTRHRLAHVAGVAYEEAGDFAKAFEAHTDAKRAVASPFDLEAHVQLIDRLVTVFSTGHLAGLPRSRQRNQTPVFIAGMPRCGTTLVEQIIDAHPDAFGAGEDRGLEKIVTDLQIELASTEPFPECMLDLTEADAERLAARYLAGLPQRARAAKRVVNKNLENYKLLGLIAVLFPAARIIHCHRDPRDTCLSCFTSDILPAAHPYLCDLRHLGLVYRQYERLMEHWKQVLDLPILDVRYEQLVDDQEGQSRRIIEFCGLPWNDACLRYYASGRVVMTLSYDQVRRPIYRSSIGRYQKYGALLDPLLEALGGRP